MKSECETISAKVNVAMLEKADRLFRNDDDGIWIELLQNARRAGAAAVDISVKEVQATSGQCEITIRDDGGGIDDFQSLITLGASGWNMETQMREDPAGMGFFCMCRSEVEVHSGHRLVRITPSVFLGKGEAQVETTPELVRGTRVRFTRASTRAALIGALERVAEFYPLEVSLEGQQLQRHDFLEGALYRESIDGIEVGFSTAFKWGWHWRDLNWNFYGARIREPFEAITGLLGTAKNGPPSEIHARFNVLEIARVKLQLPDRRGIIQDDFLRDFERKARAAAYRFFQGQQHHALPFKNWKEAKTLGVDLSEAAYLLTSWHASPQDDNIEPLFGHSERQLLKDVSNAILVARDLPDAHTLEAALHCGASVEGNLYEEKAEYNGYSWYDGLPRIVTTTVFADDVSYEEWLPTNGRPKKIDIEIAIKQAGQSDRRSRLPGLIHIPSDSYGEINFVSVSQSPWDNDELCGPFPVTDFLVSATFCASDDAGCDSWETQKNAWDEAVEREVNAYFRGPRATLLAILRKAINWEASDLAEQIDIKEIRFKRTSPDRLGWDIELAN
jgi:hypothetical protein